MTDRDLRITSFLGPGMGGAYPSTAEAIGWTLEEFFGTDDESAPIAAHRCALDGHTVSYEFSDGPFTYYGIVKPLVNADGLRAGTISSVVDVTERKGAEVEDCERARAAEQAEKIERQAVRFIGWTFLVLAAAVGYESFAALRAGQAAGGYDGSGGRGGPFAE